MVDSLKIASEQLAYVLTQAPDSDDPVCVESPILMLFRPDLIFNSWREVRDS